MHSLDKDIVPGFCTESRRKETSSRRTCGVASGPLSASADGCIYLEAQEAYTISHLAGAAGRLDDKGGQL
jgi:hypothetical protein